MKQQIIPNNLRIILTPSLKLLLFYANNGIIQLIFLNTFLGGNNGYKHYRRKQKLD